eukprot:gene36790-43892_t
MRRKRQAADGSAGGNATSLLMRPAVRMQLNPRAIAALGMNLDDVRTAIANANVNQAKGSFDGPSRASTIDANDQLKS